MKALSYRRPPPLSGLFARALLWPRQGLDSSEELPPLKLEVAEQSVDGAALARYLEVCEFPYRGTMPISYPFVLGFRPQLALLTCPSFPLRALGMVHTANTFELVRPIEPDEPLVTTVRLMGVEQVRRGRELIVVTELKSGTERVFKGVAKVLSLGGGTGEKSSPRQPWEPSSEPEARFSLATDAGRRYARVSSDYNPIHLYPWSAKLLGFRRQIAHGMYLVARVLGALAPDPCRQPPRLRVQFKTPVFLPAEVALYATGDDLVTTFELRAADDGRPHVTGRLEFD